MSIDSPNGGGGEKTTTFFLPHGFKYSIVETFTGRSRTSKVTHSLSASGINMHFDPAESSSATTQAVLRNHLGNMVAVLASNDTNLIDPYKISPYGLTQNGGNAKTNQLVQDKPQYDNFQIVHFGGRVYDLYSRQFLTPDPIVPNHSNISHWGRYSYGYGNPYGHVDPTGYRQLETGGYIEGGSIPAHSSGDVPEGEVTSPFSQDRFKTDLDTIAMSERSCSGRPCRTMSSNVSDLNIGLSASGTLPYYAIVASVWNHFREDGALLPSGISGGIVQNAHETKGSFELGADYDVGLASKLLASIDVIHGETPKIDGEMSLVIGVGARVYFTDDKVSGFGFAAGFGGSIYTRPFTRHGVVTGAGGSLPFIKAEWGEID